MRIQINLEKLFPKERASLGRTKMDVGSVARVATWAQSAVFDVLKNLMKMLVVMMQPVRVQANTSNNAASSSSNSRVNRVSLREHSSSSSSVPQHFFDLAVCSDF